MQTLKSKVLATMKSTETEGAFELYVTRTPGYLWALLFRALGVHPIVVTLLSIVIGCGSAWFFAFDGFWMNLAGCGLLVWANWYDCADGQLARLTGKKTLVGRLLDGLAGDLWFFCIYFAICCRLTEGWADVWIWLLCAWAGFRCHARQCALADYYRNIHLYFLLGPAGSELDTTEQQRARIDSLRWDRRGWFERLYLTFYTAYTAGQEAQTPVFQRLRREMTEEGRLRVREEFLAGSRPLMKWANIMTFDARVGVLFVSVLSGVPWLYPLVESTVFEIIRYRTRGRHERLCLAALTRLHA